MVRTILTNPRFSIIATDYEFHVPRPGVVAGLASLAAQECQDFELIIVHDGHKNIPYEQEVDLSPFEDRVTIMNTPVRMNNWGHSSRDMGMRVARGDYIIHFNIDNNLYPNCLSTISNKIDETQSPIVIFAVKHFKINGGSPPFLGVPPVLFKIDALQLVAQRKIWEEIDYWNNLSEWSDGYIYEDMCNRYPWVNIEEVLAENY